jgi:hypothetical protein
MSLDKDEKLRHYILHCDNRFSVVTTIAQIARERSKDYNGYILDSQALTWVIQGIEPEYIKGPNLNMNKYIKPFEQVNIDDMLSYVDDNEVCDAVIESYNESKKQNHLIYLYKNIEDEPRKARVRILSRMFWYKFKEK